jgi:hypothetical protein
MIPYPSTLLFGVVCALERALENLRNGKSSPKEESADLQHYEDIVGLPNWAEVECRFGNKDQGEAE